MFFCFFRQLLTDYMKKYVLKLSSWTEVDPNFRFNISLLGDIVKQQTFMTPSGLFLISMTLLYLITAALHPQELSLAIYGFLYFLCIPSGYLLLAIYSIVNMNNVSWGTRETGGKAKTAAVSAIKRKVMEAACCKCPCWSSTDRGEEHLLELSNEQDLDSEQTAR